MNASSNKRWWGDFTVPEGEERHWRIGPLALRCSRASSEWSITYERGDDPMETALETCVASRSLEFSDRAVTSRHGFRSTSSAVNIMPALADRDVVVNTDKPFYVPAEEESTLFISAPLWVQVRVGSPARTLLDAPIFRPSDTWFGASTREGELAYAARTTARLHLEDLPRRPQRALSVVRVVNDSGTQLHIEKLKLPMPSLSLFESRDGHLWTEQVTLSRNEDGAMASLRLSDGAPNEAVDATRLVEPRTVPEKGLLIRAFGGIFGQG